MEDPSVGRLRVQLAATAPSFVHTLTVSEPPPVHIPNAEEFIAANDELIDLYQTKGASVALADFQTRLLGPDWEDVLEGLVPGAVPQIERDAETFFQADIPALLSWAFDAEVARRIPSPPSTSVGPRAVLGSLRFASWSWTGYPRPKMS